MPPSPRRLTTHQQAVLIQVLLAFPDQRVALHYSPQADDALSYARDFLAVFKAVGWHVHDPEATKGSAAPAVGLAFLSADHRLPPSADALRDALRIYAIEVASACGSRVNMTSNGFVLQIGSAA
jgi:hypothetical protein